MSGLEMKYFVLKPRGSDSYARASRAAMRRYADLIVGDNPAMAEGLRNWANAEHEASLEPSLPNPPERKP